MSKTVITVVILLLVFAGFLVLHENHLARGAHAKEIQYDPMLPDFGHLMMLFVMLFIAYLIQTLLQNFNIRTPYAAFMVLIGFMWGVLAYYDEIVFLSCHIARTKASELMYVYVPVIVFNIAFGMDVPIFLKTLPQILVIGFPVCLFTSLAFGGMTANTVGSGWSSGLGLFLGIFSAPSYPLSIITVLRQQSTRTRQIGVLLEGEALFSALIADIFYKIWLGKFEGIIKHWYQFLMVLLRIIGLGIVAGLVSGFASRSFIHHVSNNFPSVYLLVLLVPFLTYALCDLYISGCGSIAVMILGSILGMERIFLPKDVDGVLTEFWSMAAFALDVVVSVKCAIIAAVYIIPEIDQQCYALIFVCYILYYVLRFTAFFIFSPILKRTGYGMDLKNMIVCTWGGIRSPFGLQLMTAFYDHTGEAGNDPFFYIIGMYFLSMLINGSLMTTVLDFLGLTNISLARQINMNNCMKHIFSKRERTIAVLKMDGTLPDTNWTVVVDSTNIKHPYRLELEDEEDETLVRGYRFAWCGQCSKEVAQEPTKKELKEMRKEAGLRILKAKQMSYSRQYENGMMSKQAILVLNQGIELAVDANETSMKVDDLYKRFTEESCFKRFIRRRAENIAKSKEQKLKKHRPPMTYWRRLCYKLILKGRLFGKIMFLVTLLSLGLLAADIYVHPSLVSEMVRPHTIQHDYALATGRVFFTLVFWVEFVIKILAYSHIYICSHGFRYYFSSFWNVTDFIVAIAWSIAAFHAVHDSARGYMVTEADFEKDYYFMVLNAFNLLRALRILQVFEIFYPDIIRWLKKNTDAKMAFTYELGKGYIIGETEILHVLPNMIDNETIRNEMKTKIESDRLLITKVIGLVQKERPWIAITVKTTQAIRTILNGMNEAINQLKAAGWVDSSEFETLTLSMSELYKRVNQIGKVEPSPPQVIFKEVTWMQGEESVVDFLFENVAVAVFEPGDVVFHEGIAADGIYVVVTGLFSITYKPEGKTLHNQKQFGQLPIVDYMSSAKYEEESIDYIVSGNCIGELSTLTGRCYNSTVTAEAHSQVYVLSRAVLQKAMEMSPNPVTGLECRIWKEVGVRLSLPILLATPAYQAVSQNQVKYALERAFVPDLSQFKVFVVSEIIEDIVVIEGVAEDFNTGEYYVAPCCISRNVQKLILPTSSLTSLQSDMITKLLIIPARDVDEYDVMTVARDTGEMMERKSTGQCLQHWSMEKLRKRLTVSSPFFRRKRVANMPTSPEPSFLDPSVSTEDDRSGMFYASNRMEAASVFIPTEPQGTAESLAKSNRNKRSPSPHHEKTFW